MLYHGVRSTIRPCPQLKKMSTFMSTSSSPIFHSHRGREASCRHPQEIMQLFSLQSAIPYGDSQEYEQDVPDDMKELFNVRRQLSVCDGLLMYADRIVVPASLRSGMLDRIHQGHQGITKCLERIKISVWWTKITRDVNRILDWLQVNTVNHSNRISQGTGDDDTSSIPRVLGRNWESTYISTEARTI